MGTRLETHVVGLFCEVRDCDHELPWFRLVTYRTNWHLLTPEIRAAVATGWAFSLAGRLLSYCPVHAELVWQCRCVRGREHRCAKHNPYMVAQVWDAIHEPIDVSIGRDPVWWTPRKRECSLWEASVGSSLLSSKTRP